MVEQEADGRKGKLRRQRRRYVTLGSLGGLLRVPRDGPSAGFLRSLRFLRKVECDEVARGNMSCSGDPIMRAIDNPRV